SGRKVSIATSSCAISGCFSAGGTCLYLLDLSSLALSIGPLPTGSRGPGHETFAAWSGDGRVADDRCARGIGADTREQSPHARAAHSGCAVEHSITTNPTDSDPGFGGRATRH